MKKSKNIFFKKRWFVLLGTLLILFSSISSLAYVKEFSDIKKHWAKPYIETLLGKGYISGMSDGLFHPDETMTFQQYTAIIITSVYGKQKPVNGQWASGYMKLALEKGIIDKDEMLNNGSITRLNAAKVGHLALRNIIKEQDESDTSVAMQLTDFPDCKSCREHIEQFYTKGIITGRAGMIFDGDSNLTRAEGAVIISKILNVKLRTPPKALIGSINEEELLSPETAMNMIKSDKNLILLDVRNEDEHKSNYIPDSICIPLKILEDSNAGQLTDKNATIIVYCQAGGRSQKAYDLLRSLGYSHVYNIGGIGKWPYPTVRE